MHAAVPRGLLVRTKESHSGDKQTRWMVAYETELSDHEKG